MASAARALHEMGERICELEAEVEGLRSAAERVLGGARSFCESWPYTPPEGLGLQWRVKMQPALADLDELLHGPVGDAGELESGTA